MFVNISTRNKNSVFITHIYSFLCKLVFNKKFYNWLRAKIPKLKREPLITSKISIRRHWNSVATFLFKSLSKAIANAGVKSHRMFLEKAIERKYIQRVRWGVQQTSPTCSAGHFEHELSCIYSLFLFYTLYTVDNYCDSQVHSRIS